MKPETGMSERLFVSRAEHCGMWSVYVNSDVKFQILRRDGKDCGIYISCGAAPDSMMIGMTAEQFEELRKAINSSSN